MILPPHALLHDAELDASKSAVRQHLLQLFGIAPWLHQRQLRQRVRGLHTLLHLPENRLEAKHFPERHRRGAARLERAVDLLRVRHGVLTEEDAEVGQDRVERVVRIGEGLAVLEAQILNLGRERGVRDDNGLEGLHHRRYDVGGRDLGGAVDFEELLGSCAGAAGVVEDGAAYSGKGFEHWRQV